MQHVLDGAYQILLRRPGNPAKQVLFLRDSCWLGLARLLARGPIGDSIGALMHWSAFYSLLDISYRYDGRLQRHKQR